VRKDTEQVSTRHYNQKQQMDKKKETQWESKGGGGETIIDGVMCNSKNEGKSNMKEMCSKHGRKRMKEKTGNEMRAMIEERLEKGRLKKARMEARKMVKKGKMKRIDTYFKKENSNDE
jgi:hypothetical protein